jgi:hypothetical protein
MSLDSVATDVRRAQTFWKKKIRASSRRLLQFMVPVRWFALLTCEET